MCERRGSVAGQAVAEAEVRLYVAAAGQRLLELLAEPRDVYVHGAVGFPVGLAPDRVVELLSGDDPAVALREGGEQLELADRQAERRAAHHRDVLGRTDVELSHDHGATLARDPANSVIPALPGCEKPVKAARCRRAAPYTPRRWRICASRSSTRTRGSCGWLVMRARALGGGSASQGAPPPTRGLGRTGVRHVSAPPGSFGPGPG